MESKFYTNLKKEIGSDSENSENQPKIKIKRRIKLAANVIQSESSENDDEYEEKKPISKSKNKKKPDHQSTSRRVPAKKSPAAAVTVVKIPGESSSQRKKRIERERKRVKRFQVLQNKIENLCYFIKTASF